MKKNKVIICAALTGAVTPKSKSPNHPVTPDEIAADVVKCGLAGASVVHIHARDKKNPDLPVNGVDIYAEILEKINASCRAAGLDMVINFTTGVPIGSYEDRCAHVKALKPEMMSYDVGSFNYDDALIYANEPAFLRYAGKMAIECNVKPEIEIFDTGHIRSANTYIKEGVLKAPCHYQFVLGAGGAMDGTIENIAILKNMLPEGSTWSATGIGLCHLPVMYAALAAGCDGIRVGLEDNVYYAKGVKASNEMLVKRAAEIIRLFGCEPATPSEARDILGLTRKTIG